MKVLVTGSKGFIGQNLISELERLEGVEVLPFDIDSPAELLDGYCRDCDFVYNLAGVNRPQRAEEFMEGNAGFVATLLQNLRKHSNICAIMNASSVQAALDNPYGESKRAGEDLLFAYGREVGTKILNYRFPNVFGKWSRPDYNSAVATFCYHIARNMPVRVNDRNTALRLVYIDDVVRELLRALDGHPNLAPDGYCCVSEVHETTLGEIVDLLYRFRESRESLMVPDVTEGSFAKKLYSTYLSFLPEDSFSYPLTMHEDGRGSFTEILKSPNCGQVSVNVTKPGIIRGDHWHHTKNEKFVVVSGEGLIRFRKHGSEEIFEYRVSGKKLEVVDVPTGYTHSVTNIGDTDLVMLIWCNECYDPKKSDTVSEPVEESRQGGL